jgi:hypothetical protein
LGSFRVREVRACVGSDARRLVLLTNAMEIFADHLPRYLDGQVSKKVKSTAAPPLQVILAGIEAYRSVNTKLVLDKAGFLDQSSCCPCMDKGVRNDDYFVHAFAGELPERFIENVLGVQVYAATFLVGGVGVSNYPDVNLISVEFTQKTSNFLLSNDDCLHVVAVASVTILT